MEQFARFLMDEIGYELPTGAQLCDISQLSYRYSMYKVGPVLSVSVSSSTGSSPTDTARMYKVGPVLSVSVSSSREIRDGHFACLCCVLHH